MSEAVTSVPPSTSKTPTTAQGSREHAMAYYEKVRKQLRDLIQAKRHQDKQLVRQTYSKYLPTKLLLTCWLETLYEDNIFKAETTYLEETQNGNIIKGFDNYIKGGVTRRRTNFSDSDRIFSLSSLTYAAKVRTVRRDNVCWLITWFLASRGVDAGYSQLYPDRARFTSHKYCSCQ